MNFAKHYLPSLKSGLIKKFIFYSAGSLVLKLTTACIGLVTIRFLSPQEFGLLSLLNNFIMILPVFMNLGLRQAYGVDYFHLDTHHKKEMLKKIITLYLYIATPIFLGSVFFIPHLNVYIFNNQATSLMLCIALITAYIHFFFELYLQQLRYALQVMQLTTMQLITAMLTISATILLVYIYKASITGIILANLFGMSCLVVWAGMQYKKIIGMRLSAPTLKESSYYIHLGAPFIVSIICTWILSSGNRWFLATYTNLHEVGIYSLADYATQLFNLVVLYPLSATYVPYIFNEFAKNRSAIKQLDDWNKKNMYSCMLLITIVCVIGFFIGKPIFYKIVPTAYYPAINYMLGLMIGQTFFMGSYFATCYLQFYKRNFLLVSFTITSSLISCLLNMFLIPLYGIWGAIISSTLGYALYFILIVISTNIYKARHD